MKVLFASLATAMAQEFTWQAGYVADREANNVRAKMPQQSMLYTLICGVNNADCQFSEEDIFSALENYGYNCFTGKTTSKYNGATVYHMGSHGDALDEIDSACLAVHKAYKCMFLDEKYGNLKQGSSTYNGTKVEGCAHGLQFAYHLNNAGDIVCGPKRNPGYAKNVWHGCRDAACEIEKEFAYKVAGALANPKDFEFTHADNYNAVAFEMGALNPLLKSAYQKEKTNVAAAAAAKELTEFFASVQRDEQCCGNYPTRAPYNSYTQECCAQGEIHAIGRCG